MATPRITVIIPAFNEEESISQVVQGLKDEFPHVEIIVIDDGSSDATAKRAREAGAQVISHSRNFGYGAALKTGVREAAGDYTLFCDGDGQHRIEDIKAILTKCTDFELVVGARGNDSHRPIIRRPGKWLLKLYTNFLAGTKIPDLNSGLRVFKKESLVCYLHLMPQGFSFSSTSTFAFLKSNRSICYVPIKVNKRVGKSSVNQVKDGISALFLILRLSVLFEPLKVFMSVALIFFILGILSFILDSFSSGGLFAGGGVGDTTVLFFVSTIIVFMSGLLCDQISALRREFHE